MTPAVTLLKKNKTPFELLSYDHDSGCTNFGLEAVEKLALEPGKVFKTLVLTTVDGQLLVAVCPVEQQINLKLLAKECGSKKVKLADAHQVENTTGYILGGVSPFGQKKRLPTYLHSSANQYEHIYVSAGKRGLEIKISPDDLKRLCRASLAEF